MKRDTNKRNFLNKPKHKMEEYSQRMKVQIRQIFILKRDTQDTNSLQELGCRQDKKNFPMNQVVM